MVDKFGLLSQEIATVELLQESLAPCHIPTFDGAVSLRSMPKKIQPMMNHPAVTGT